MNQFSERATGGHLSSSGEVPTDHTPENGEPKPAFDKALARAESVWAPFKESNPSGNSLATRLQNALEYAEQIRPAVFTERNRKNPALRQRDVVGRLLLSSVRVVAHERELRGYSNGVNPGGDRLAGSFDTIIKDDLRTSLISANKEFKAELDEYVEAFRGASISERQESYSNLLAILIKSAEITLGRNLLDEEKAELGATRNGLVAEYKVLKSLQGKGLRVGYTDPETDYKKGYDVQVWPSEYSNGQWRFLEITSNSNKFQRLVAVRKGRVVVVVVPMYKYSNDPYRLTDIETDKLIGEF